MSKSKKKSKKKSIDVNKILKPLSFLKWRAWYSTIFFFIVLLVTSVWLWWNCFYYPQPSNEIIIEVREGQKDYDAMKAGIENTMEILKERQGRFSNSPSFSFQRELFMDPSQQNDLPEVEPVESAELVKPIGDQNILEDDENNVPEEPKKPKEPEETVDEIIQQTP